MLWLALSLSLGLPPPPGACMLVSPRIDTVKECADAAAAQLGPTVPRFAADADAAQLRAQCTKAVLALGAAAVRRAQSLLPDVPLVYAAVAGAYHSTPPSGKRVTGVPWDAPATAVLQLLHTAAPAVQRVGVVYEPQASGAFVQTARPAAQALGLTLVEQPVASLGEAVRAFNRFEKELPVQALWLLADATATARETVFYALELAHWQRIPVLGPSRWYVAHGALLALQPHAAAHGQAAAQLLLQMLQGRVSTPPPPADVAVLYDLLLNRQVAGQLDLHLPRSLLERAQDLLP